MCKLSPEVPGLKLPQPLGTIQYPLPTTKPLKHDEILWRIGGFDDERGRKVRREMRREKKTQSKMCACVEELGGQNTRRRRFGPLGLWGFFAVFAKREGEVVQQC